MVVDKKGKRERCCLILPSGCPLSSHRVWFCLPTQSGMTHYLLMWPVFMCWEDFLYLRLQPFFKKKNQNKAYNVHLQEDEQLCVLFWLTLLHFDFSLVFFYVITSVTWGLDQHTVDLWCTQNVSQRSHRKSSPWSGPSLGTAQSENSLYTSFLQRKQLSVVIHSILTSSINIMPQGQ